MLWSSRAVSAESCPSRKRLLLRGPALAFALVCFVAVALMLPSAALAPPAPVDFPDPALDAAVRTAIGKPVGQIDASDLATLTTLAAKDKGIVHLDGLEYATSLTVLDLSKNDIATITPVSGLTSLTSLSLGANEITDAAPVAGLTNLSYLDLYSNQISDISPVSGLANLSYLYFGYNQISDIAPVSGLTTLTVLGANNNQITTITPVGGLTRLTHLYLHYNQIATIAPLATLTDLRYLHLTRNQVTDLTPLSGLTDLEHLSLQSNEIHDVGALSDLTELYHLDIGANHVSSFGPLSDLTGLNLLYAGYNSASDLQPLAGLTNLLTLSLGGDGITDVSPLGGLTKLTNLYLGSNHIRDVGPLASLTALNNLYLSDNDVFDISPLATLSPDYLHLVHNWLDLAPGSSASQTIDAWLAKGATVDYLPQHESGAVAGTVRTPSGAALSGVQVVLPVGMSATSTAAGTYAIRVAPPLAQSVTFSKPYWNSATVTATVGIGATTTVNATLTPVQLPLTIKRSPTGYRHAYRRKSGVARFTFSATLTDARGVVAGKKVYLQKRKSGGSWKTAYTMITNSKGKASHRFAARKKGTTYYRWVSKANACDQAKTLPSQKVVIK